MIAEFTHDGRTLDLTQSPYSADRLIPPPLNTSRIISAGTTGNYYAAGKRIHEQANDRNMSFQVRVHGTSAEDIQAKVRRLQSFVYDYRNGGPMIFWHTTSNIPRPLWGVFGAPLAYEIVSVGTVEMTEDYYSLSLRKSGVRVIINMEVAPIAETKSQREVYARGAVALDQMGRDGCSRGIRSLPVLTNYITNPVFGHSTWNTGWATSGTIIVQKNSDKRYLFPGSTYSARLYATSATNAYVIPATVPVTAIGGALLVAQVKKGDSSAVTSADVTLVYDMTGSFVAADNITYYPLEDGYYLVYGWVTGDGTSNLYGVRVGANRGVHLCGLAVYDSPPYTGNIPIIHGDMLGASWSGTAHASTSTTEAGELALFSGGKTDSLNGVTGSVYISVRADVANTAASGNLYLWACDNGGPSLRYDAAAAAFKLTSGAATATVAATFAVNDAIGIAVTWGASGMSLHVNTLTPGTNASFTPFSPSSMWIGADTSNANKFPGLVQIISTYDATLTTDQAQALISAGQTVTSGGSSVPFTVHWAKAGGGLSYNCNDSNYDNWSCVFGIPGTHPAGFEMVGAQNVQVATHISINDSSVFINPGYFWNDRSGTVDANSSGGQYQSISVGTSYTTIGTVTITSPAILRDYVFGREWYGFTRLREAAGTGTVNAKVIVTVGTQAYESAPVQWPTSTTFIGQRSGKVHVPKLDYIWDDSYGLVYSVTLTLQIARTSGTADMYVDFANFLPSNLAYLLDTSGNNCFIYDGDGEVLAMTNASFGNPHLIYSTQLDDLYLEPNRFNNLVFHIGASGSAYTVTDQIIHGLFVKPRYALL